MEQTRKIGVRDRVNWIHPLGLVCAPQVVAAGESIIGPYAIITCGKTVRVRVPLSSIRLITSEVIKVPDGIKKRIRKRRA